MFHGLKILVFETECVTIPEKMDLRERENGKRKKFCFIHGDDRFPF